MNIDPAIIVLVLFGVVAFGIIVALQSMFSVWLKCWLAGAYISYPEIIAIRMRKSPIEKITDAYVRIRKHNIGMTVMEIEEEYIKNPKRFDTYIDILIEEHQKSRSEQIDDGNSVKPPGDERTP